MSQLRILLDTNVVIALMNASASVAQRLRQHAPQEVAVPTVALQELYFGAYKSQRVEHNLSKVSQLAFAWLPFTAQDAVAAGRIRAELARAGTPIGPYDALIAAQALTREVTLVTHNTREFARVPGLRLDDWL